MLCTQKKRCLLERKDWRFLSQAGLVSVWRFDGDATDSYGGSPMSLVNSPTYVAGKFVQAISLASASSQRCRVDSNPSLQGGVPHVWAVHVYPISTGGREIVTKYGANASLSDYAFELTASKFTYTVYRSASAYTATATTFGTVTANAWYFALGGYDGANTFVSVNGGAFDTAAVTGTPNALTAAVNVGSYNEGAGLFWNGYVDALYFFKPERSWLAANLGTLRDYLYQRFLNSSQL